MFCTKQSSEQNLKHLSFPSFMTWPDGRMKRPDVSSNRFMNKPALASLEVSPWSLSYSWTLWWENENVSHKGKASSHLLPAFSFAILVAAGRGTEDWEKKEDQKTRIDCAPLGLVCGLSVQLGQILNRMDFVWGVLAFIPNYLPHNFTCALPTFLVVVWSQGRLSWNCCKL